MALAAVANALIAAVPASVAGENNSPIVVIGSRQDDTSEKLDHVLREVDSTKTNMIFDAPSRVVGDSDP